MKTKDINIDTTNPENWTDEKWVAAYLNIKPNTLRKQRSVGVNYVPYKSYVIVAGVTALLTAAILTKLNKKNE